MRKPCSARHLHWSKRCNLAFDALQKCLQTEHPILQGENLEAMCGCASDNFTEAIDLKAAQNMYQQTADGRFDHYRMMMFAYAPCVKEVVQRTVLEDCANNKKNRYLMKNLRATCSCIATRVSDAMNRLAPKLIEGDIAHKRYFRNPVDVLIKPDAFNRYLRHASPQCVDIHERRKR